MYVHNRKPFTNDENTDQSIIYYRFLSYLYKVFFMCIIEGATLFFSAFLQNR